MRPPTVSDSAFARVKRDFAEIEPSRRAEARRLLAPEVRVVDACEYYDIVVVDPLSPSLPLDPDGCPSPLPHRRHRLYFGLHTIRGTVVAAVYSRHTDVLYVCGDPRARAVPPSELTQLALDLGSQ